MCHKLTRKNKFHLRHQNKINSQRKIHKLHRGQIVSKGFKISQINKQKLSKSKNRLNTNQKAQQFKAIRLKFKKLQWLKDLNKLKRVLESSKLSNQTLMMISAYPECWFYILTLLVIVCENFQAVSPKQLLIFQNRQKLVIPLKMILST